MARKRQRPAAARCVVLVLCAALFAWGMYGKFSGDRAPKQSHPKSVVKLIQDDETRRLAVFAPVAPRSLLLDSADITAVHSQPLLIVDRIQLVHEPAPDSPPSHTYALRFRPPPSGI
jgi:hypothetical protein